MTLEQFGIYSEIISSVAVIASLIYVARQLKQTTDAIHSQSRESIKDGALSEIFKIFDNPELLLLISDNDDLTRLEQSKLNAFFVYSLRSREYSWLQYKNGVIDKSQWDTELAVTKFFLDSIKLRIWWKKFGKNVFSPEYGAFIESLISAAPATDKGFLLETTWFNQETDESS
jgi:hypothetical protein